MEQRSITQGTPMILHEIDLAGVFVSPLLIASLLGFVAAWLTAKSLNRLRLSRYFSYPRWCSVRLSYSIPA